MFKMKLERLNLLQGSTPLVIYTSLGLISFRSLKLPYLEISFVITFGLIS